MHMKVVWQSLNVCATKNSARYLTFTENFSPLINWMKSGLVQQHSKTIVHFFIKAPNLLYMLTEGLLTI